MMEDFKNLKNDTELLKTWFKHLSPINGGLVSNALFEGKDRKFLTLSGSMITYRLRCLKGVVTFQIKHCETTSKVAVAEIKCHTGFNGFHSRFNK